MKVTNDVAILVPAIDCDQKLQNMISRVLLDETLKAESIIVVIDGGVTESEAMNYLLSRGVKFKVNHQRGGVAKALNLGLDAISSQHVRRMDSDDEWIAGSLNSNVVNLLNEYTLVFGYTLNKKNGEYYKSAIPDLPGGELSRFAFLPGNPITHPTVCFDAKKIRELGGYAQFASAEDFELWMRLLLGGNTIYNSNLPTVVYSRDQNLASGNLLSKMVLEEVKDKWLELVGVDFGLNAEYLGLAICRNIECGHTLLDVKKYKKDLSRTLKKLRMLHIHPRLYMNIFIRSLITIIAHESKLKAIAFCFGELILKPSLVSNFLLIYLQDRQKLFTFKKLHTRS
jgi:glycosyltransferase involved in cell wall biosynthesis